MKAVGDRKVLGASDDRYVKLMLSASEGGRWWLPPFLHFAHVGIAIATASAKEDGGMMTMVEAAKDFLAQKRIAVVGVSRQPNQAANFIFRKLRDAGHEVVPVNPRASAIEGVTCYPDLKSVPGSVGAVVVSTPPSAAEAGVRECAELGITRIWLHRAFGQGSVSDGAVRLAQERKLTLIPGGCPAMFCEPVDLGHKCMRWFLRVTGGLPASVEGGGRGPGDRGRRTEG
jgi:predicted CoA-binding protein